MFYAEVSDLDTLEALFNRYSSGYLFRGQTAHYRDPTTQQISIPTSFARHGCVPDLMFKWSHYARAIIRAVGGGEYHRISLETSQAILQHYGWRSFYVDLTKTPGIACWFACNSGDSGRKIHMCEDWQEDPVWLVHEHCRYSSTGQPGHVYVIDIEALKKLNVGVHDLTEVEAKDGRIRPLVQSACLAGSLKKELPPEAIVAHLSVTHEVLSAYCGKCSLHRTADVFPPREEDFILDALLRIPWRRVGGNDMPIPTYRRGLPLPEYDIRFEKHLSPTVALYTEFWIADRRNDLDSRFSRIPFFRLGETAYYANTDEPFDLDEVNRILATHEAFVIELDGLIAIPESQTRYEYEKGILVERGDDGLVCVMGLVVEHPGQVISGLGAIKGWHYQITDGAWSEVEHPDRCPCNNDLRHQLQFSMLRVLNAALRENEMISIDATNWVHKSIWRLGSEALRQESPSPD